jgi:hypothetical protein
VNYILPGVPLYLRGYSGNNIIGGSNEDKLGSISHILIVVEGTAGN